jgi:hypothetical protein
MHSERGSIIVFSVLLLTVILTVSLGLIAIFIPKLRTIAESINSTTAIFAADSATELCIYEARKKVNYDEASSTMNDGTLDNGATFAVKDLNPPGNFIQADCSALSSASFSFRAVGTYRAISRALEITQ